MGGEGRRKHNKLTTRNNNYKLSSEEKKRKTPPLFFFPSFPLLVAPLEFRIFFVGVGVGGGKWGEGAETITN